MKRFMRWLLAPALAFGLCPAPAVEAALPGPVVGQSAPDFALTTLDGKRVALADFRGKTLVINVWGSWCPPCRIETPDLIAEAQRDPRHVAFLGIDTTESAEVVRAFVAAKAIPYPQVATTAAGPFARAYAIRAYPTTFVIDPQGVLRARHADNLLPAAQLRAYVTAAQRSESAPVATAFQAQLDASLDPARFPFNGDPQTVRASVASAAAAIAHADDLLEDAMEDPARDHDLDKTKGEEQTLRLAAIAALTPLAATRADRVLLARLRGDEAAAQDRWSDAEARYGEALQIEPDDLQALQGAAYAASQRGELARVVELRAHIAALRPSAAAFVALGRAQAAARAMPLAEHAFDRAQALAAPNPALLAWTNLYYARAEASAGNRAAARAAFARASNAAGRVPRSDPRAVWYLEQAQEGTVALDVVRGAAPALSLAPWTGPDLPGSLESTLKYRLVVTGTPGAPLVLAARGLPAHWIGSFCSDRVCAPFRTELVVPPQGVKVIEFQVVPTTPAKGARTVYVDALSGGRTVAKASVEIHR